MGFDRSTKGGFDMGEVASAMQKCIRSLLYVDDCVDALVKAMATQHPAPINVGSTDERSVTDIAQVIAERLRSRGFQTSTELVDKGNPDDVMQRRPVIERAESLLDWRPFTSLEDGLDETIQYWMNKL